MFWHLFYYAGQQGKLREPKLTELNSRGLERERGPGGVNSRERIRKRGGPGG